MDNLTPSPIGVEGLPSDILNTNDNQNTQSDEKIAANNIAKPITLNKESTQHPDTIQTDPVNTPQSPVSIEKPASPPPQYQPQYQRAMYYQQNFRQSQVNNQSGYIYPQGYTYRPKPSNVPNYAGAANAFPMIYRQSPQEIAKENINKAATTGGALTIAIYISMMLVAVIVIIVGFFCGIIRNTPEIGDDPYMGFTQMGFYFYEGVTSLLSITIPALIIILRAKKTHNVTVDELLPFDKIGGKKLTAIVFGGMGICMVAQLMSIFLSMNLKMFGIDIEDAVSMTFGTSPIDIMMNSICTALIPALTEELAYRGVVLGILKKYDTNVAIIGSAFLFGMLHGNLAQIPFAFVIGLVLAYVRVKTNSMLPNILIHFGNNFYAVIVSTLLQDVTEGPLVIVDTGVMIILTAGAFFCIYYLSKKHPDFFKLDTKPQILSNKEKFGTFFTTGTVIASTIILLIQTVAVIKLL